MSITSEVLRRIDATGLVFESRELGVKAKSSSLSSALDRLVQRKVLARLAQGRYRRLVPNATTAYMASLHRKSRGMVEATGTMRLPENGAKPSVTLGILQRIDAAGQEFRGLDVRADAHRAAHGTVLKRLVKKKILEPLGHGQYRRLVPSVTQAYVGSLKNESTTTVGANGDGGPPALADKVQTATYQVLQCVHNLPELFLLRDVNKAAGAAKGSATFTLKKLVERGVINRVGSGQYRKLVPDVLRVYYERSGKAGAKPNPEPVQLRVRPEAEAGSHVVPWGKNTLLIVAYPRAFLVGKEQEVAFVKRADALTLKGGE